MTKKKDNRNQLQKNLTQWVDGRTKKGRELKKQQQSNRDVNIKWHGDYGYNKHGVEFTREEHKALQYAVNSVKRKKDRLMDSNNLQAQVLGYDYSKKRLNDSYDLIFANHSKSLHQFKNREEYENMMNELNKMKDRAYIDNQINDYKDMFLKGIHTITTDKADYEEIKKAVDGMSNEEFAKRMQLGFVEMVEFIYDPTNLSKRLNTIKNRLGLDTVDESLIITKALKTPQTRIPYKPNPKKKRK